MATVADDPRARKARAPRPAAPPPAPQGPEIPPDRFPAVNDSVPEGWERGGQAPPQPAPSGPAERHGMTSLWASIGGVKYRLRKVAAGPPVAVCWTLTKIQPDPLRAPVAYAVASDGSAIKCTCTDHVHNGADCKHIRSLVAHGIIERPAPPPPPPPPVVPAPSPREQADGFRRAVVREIRRKLKTSPCSGCGVEIEPSESYLPDVALCGDCFDREGGRP